MTRWRALVAPVLLLVLTASFFWKLTLTREWTFLEGYDQAVQVRPWLDYAAREVHAGRIPLWDPYEWGGQTLIGQVQPGIANPLNWLLFAMPLDAEGHIPVTTLHWYWVLIHWMGALFAYALCRDLGARFVPALLGGCIFALTGFLGHTDWPQVIFGAVWIPLILLFFFRVGRGYRPISSAACGGLAMGLAFCGTHHVIPTFTGLLMSGMWAVLVARRPRRLREFAVWAGIAGQVAAFQVLPALEYSRLAIRWAGAPEPVRPGERVPFSVHAQYSLKWRELPAIVLPRGATHVNPYCGATACGLALVALWRRWKLARWLAGLACGALLVALASPPYWLVWRFAPMVEKAREPAFAVVIAQVAIASMAALGLTCLPRWAGPVALALFLGEAVNHAPRFARFDRPGSYASMQREQAPVMAYLKQQRGWFRVDFDEAAVPYNAGDLYGIEQFGAAVSSMPVRVHRMLGREETARVFGVRYRVGTKASNASQEAVFEAGGLKVFRDGRIGEAMRGIHSRPCEDAFRVMSRGPGWMEIEAEMGCEGLAVVGDPFYPGWRGYVDGRRVPVQEVDGVRALRVGAGRHRVEFRYRPASVYWGAGLSLLGLGLAVVLGFRE